MTRHMANQGGGNYEEGVWYDLTLKEVSTQEGQYGPQLLFKFDSFDGQSEEWIWTSVKLGKHQGRVSKLRGICNALFHKPENTEIEWLDDDTMEVKYEGSVHRLEAGLSCQGRGEFFEGKDGLNDTFRLTRFRGSGAKELEATTQEALKLPKKKAEEKVTADQVPF